MSLASRFYRLGACILWEPREREFVELCLTPRPDVKGKRRGEAQEKHTHYGVHADIRSSSQRSPTLLARPRERCRSASSLPAGAPQLAGHQSWRVPKSVPPIFPFGSPFWAYTCCHYGPCWTPRLGFRFLRRTTPMSDPCQHAKWESAASCVRHGRAVSPLLINPQTKVQHSGGTLDNTRQTKHHTQKIDETPPAQVFFLGGDPILFNRQGQLCRACFVIALSLIQLSAPDHPRKTTCVKVTFANRSPHS